jgi:chorismate mutase/prephenate dehydratase
MMATTPDEPRTLETLRSFIDNVDNSLVQLLNERARLVVEVGKRKSKDGTPVYAPAREQMVLKKVLSLNTGPLLNTTLEAVYREIMSGSFALERPLRIGVYYSPSSFRVNSLQSACCGFCRVFRASWIVLA